MKNINPLTPKGVDQLNEVRKLMGKICPITEGKTPNAILELSHKAPDGKVYGIVKENQDYYLKIAEPKEKLTVNDFKYIGGLKNKRDMVYESYAKAAKQLKLKLISLQEAYGVDKDYDTNILKENFGFGGMGFSPDMADGNLDGGDNSYEEEYCEECSVVENEVAEEGDFVVVIDHIINRGFNNREDAVNFFNKLKVHNNKELWLFQDGKLLDEFCPDSYKLDEEKQDLKKKDRLTESFTVKLYRIHLKHDDGEFTIKTSASSPEAAKKKVMDVEGCPESSVISVEELNESINEQITEGSDFGGYDKPQIKEMFDTGNFKLKFVSWFTGSSLCDVQHPEFGNHKLTPEQIKYSDADYKNQIVKCIKDNQEAILNTFGLEETQYKLKVDVPEPETTGEPMGGETPDFNMEEPPSTEKPFDDEPFDPDVDADEETDPKKFIQQMAGKIAQSLRSYTKDEGEPDFELEKFVINSIISATNTSQMDKSDQKDIINKIKEAGDNQEGGDELSDELADEPKSDEVDDETELDAETPPTDAGDINESEDKSSNIKQEFGVPKGADIRVNNGVAYIYYDGDNPDVVNWVEQVREKYPTGVVYTNTKKVEKNIQENLGNSKNSCIFVENNKLDKIIMESFTNIDEIIEEVLNDTETVKPGTKTDKETDTGKPKRDIWKKPGRTNEEQINPRPKAEDFGSEKLSY